MKKEQRCFTDEEVGKILGAAPEPFGTILALTALLGLRIGEVLALRVSDVDFSRKIVRVQQSLDGATRKVQAVKSQASSADVPMPSQLEARLRAHLRQAPGDCEHNTYCEIIRYGERRSEGGMQNIFSIAFAW